MEQPLRRAEVDDFFLGAVRRSTRQSMTRLDLVISRDSGTAARDLTERQTRCCSFFASISMPQQVAWWCGSAFPMSTSMSSMPRKPGSSPWQTRRRSTATSENGLRSGEVADAAGLNVQTLRRNERRGFLHERGRTLLPPPASRTQLFPERTAHIADMKHIGRRCIDDRP